MKPITTERGLIEKREIIYNPDRIAFFAFFVLVIDKLTMRVLSQYGPFENLDHAISFAKSHGIEIG